MSDALTNTDPLGETLSRYHRKLVEGTLTPEDDAELAEEFAVNRCAINQLLAEINAGRPKP